MLCHVELLVCMWFQIHWTTAASNGTKCHACCPCAKIFMAWDNVPTSFTASGLNRWHFQIPVCFFVFVSPMLYVNVVFSSLSYPHFACQAASKFSAPCGSLNWKKTRCKNSIRKSVARAVARLLLLMPKSQENISCMFTVVKISREDCRMRNTNEKEGKEII